MCQPHEVKHRSMSLGEILKGDRLAYSQYSIKFKGNIFQSLIQLENYFQHVCIKSFSILSKSLSVCEKEGSVHMKSNNDTNDDE